MPRLQQAHPVDASNFTLGTTNLRSRKATGCGPSRAVPVVERPLRRSYLLLNTEDVSGRRKAGSGSRAACSTPTFWVGRASGITSAVYTQFLPSSCPRPTRPTSTWRLRSTPPGDRSGVRPA